MPGFGVQVGLIDGDEGCDVDNGVFGQARKGGRQEDVTGHGSQAGAGGDDGGKCGVQAADIKRIGLDDENRAPFGGPAAVRFAQVGPADAAAADHQSSPEASRSRPASAAAAAESSLPAALSASLTCWVSDREASSSR